MSWLDLVGWVGSAVLVWSLLQTRILRLRAFNLIGCLILIGFNGALRVWPMVGLNIVLAIINVFYLRKLLAARHDDREFAVVAIAPDSEYLAYTLRLHSADIARFNPGFVPEAPPADRSAFLVVRGEETVGLLLFRTAAPGVAQVELDYVTPRYRDFTPGEFVYRRSQLFAARGYRRVVTPKGMVAPYYAKLGFRPEGDAYVLDLTV